MPKYPTFLSDLAETDRKHITNCINKLLLHLRCCEGRLRLYEAEEVGEVHRSGQTVFKLLQDLNAAGVMIDEMKNELVEKHGLPNDIKQISEDFRQTFRNVLMGVVPPE